MRAGSPKAARYVRPAVQGTGPTGPTAAGSTAVNVRLVRCGRTPTEGTWSVWADRQGPRRRRSKRCGFDWIGSLAMGLTRGLERPLDPQMVARVLGSRTAVPLLHSPCRPILRLMTDAFLVHRSRVMFGLVAAAPLAWLLLVVPAGSASAAARGADWAV